MSQKLTEQAVDVRHRQARRMQLVGQLTGGIVHDFNNIFTAIAGTLEILTEAVAHADGEVAVANEAVVTIDAPNAGISMGDTVAVLADLDMAQDCLTPSGSRIEVRSEAGRGIAIRIYLPKAASSI